MPLFAPTPPLTAIEALNRELIRLDRQLGNFEFSARHQSLLGNNDPTVGMCNEILRQRAEIQKALIAYLGAK